MTAEDEDDITEAINAALDGVSQDHEFTDAAAAALAAAIDDSESTELPNRLRIARR